ncbi:glycosyltransferase family 2 protein [Niveibacterium sp. SC-1]|uniref:glycosyltransferase family 2 protein n=1 Tax=Niveibacterium sp. SC-1 TaxID=3135646 RepID=UPI00311EA6E2
MRGKHRFRSEGRDPHFRLEGHVPAGWHMVEVQMQMPVVRGIARFYPDFGEGESEADAFSLPLRSGKRYKRLIYLRAPAALRFDPFEAPGDFRLEHFSILPVSATYAATRIQHKLQGRHPRHRQGLAEDCTPDTLWTDYCKLFERRVQALISYAEWIKAVERPQWQAMALEAPGLNATRPARFSIVMPVYNSDAAHLQACLDSVLAQTYAHWELCVADDASTAPHIRPLLERYAASDARIRIEWRERNGHISAASNSALSLATGDFIVLLDHDDLLSPYALQAMAEAILANPDADILYSDEDKLNELGERIDPFLKPDWNPDLLYSQNYVSHLGVYRRTLVAAAGGFREGYEGSQDYDLLLRCLARNGADPARIVHVRKVLYHWRMTETSTAQGHGRKDYASDAGRRALQDYFDQVHPGVQASVVSPGVYRHRWPLPQPAPLISLIVPTRDGHDILRTCIESILAKTTYPNYEILIVDNQSTCPDTLAYIAELQASHPERVRVLAYDAPFNYSAINNHAARHARGSILGLINNDVEVIEPDWLTEMVSHALRPDIGCVGAKLYYPDDTLQHGGVVLGIGGVAGHANKYLSRDQGGYFDRMRTIYNPSAVTAAALLVRKTTFDAVGGLDDANLFVAFNDVDFCLRVREAGFRNLWTCHAELYHHESKTRGADASPEKAARFLRETEWMRQRWGALLKADPAYHPALSQTREDYGLDIPACEPGARIVVGTQLTGTKLKELSCS